MKVTGLMSVRWELVAVNWSGSCSELESTDGSKAGSMGVSRLCSRGVGGAVSRGARSCLNDRSEELIEQAGSNK